MYTEKSTEVLAYGQEIFDQLCHGRATKSLLEHLNDGVRARICDDEDWESVCIEMINLHKEFDDLFWKKQIRRELTKEDIIKWIDWYVIIWELGSIDYGRLGESSIAGVEFFMATEKAEYIHMVEDYYREIRKYATSHDFQQHICGLLLAPVENYLREAEKGDDWAQAMLGHIYAESLCGCAQDYVKAAKWYAKAAKTPVRDKSFILGPMIGPMWFAASSVRGLGMSRSLYPLGKMYALGQGVEQDDVQAAYWYRKAAEEDLPEAQYELGNMYATGRGGIAQDDGQAVLWYRKAADHDHMEAQYELGKMYATSRGFAQSESWKATSWYRKAAEGEPGFALAQYELGNIYASGWGTVDKDDEQATYWYRRAAEQGLAEAKNKLGQ